MIDGDEVNVDLMLATKKKSHAAGNEEISHKSMATSCQSNFANCLWEDANHCGKQKSC